MPLLAYENCLEKDACSIKRNASEKAGNIEGIKKVSAFFWPFFSKVEDGKRPGGPLKIAPRKSTQDFLGLRGSEERRCLSLAYISSRLGEWKNGERRGKKPFRKDGYFPDWKLWDFVGA